VTAVHLVGRRLSSGPLEDALAKDLVVADPALVPLGPDEAALLLPDATLGAQVDRVLVDAEPSAPLVTGLAVRAEAPGTIVVGGRSSPVGATEAVLALPEGDHIYVLTGGGKRVVGAVRMAAGHRVELGIDPRARSVSYTERARR
jgi:hypothetical protein